MMPYDNLAQRQPRSGTRNNNARAVYNSSNGRYEVQLLNLAVATTSYSTVLSLENEFRATSIAERLNNIFANSRADLDFITPGYSAEGYYTVIWSGTTWLGEDVFVQKTECGDTYEDLYRGCDLPMVGGEYYKYSKESATTIATVTPNDVIFYGKSEWEIAFEWANRIRGIVNGWNCTYGSTFKNSDGTPLIVNDGKIYFLQTPTSTFQSKYNIPASYYGVGEIQPGPQTANGDIFHTLDPTVARPSNYSNYGLSLNMWVRVTYGNKSVVARVTDQCGTTKIDLSAGLAVALGFKGTGTVTISRP